MKKNFWESERIRVRSAEEADLVFLVESRKSPDSLRQWYEDEILFPLSEKEARDGFTSDLSDFYKDDKKLFILETLNADYAGQLQIWQVNRRAGVFRHGIFLEEEYRGKGFAKEALLIVLDFYFNELNYRKCNPYVYSYNKHSQKFHENFGFKLEARVKEEHFTRGVYHDLLYYSLFREEFNKLYGNKLWGAGVKPDIDVSSKMLF